MGFEFKIFQALHGRWTIQRNIHNFGTIEGLAKFSRKKNRENEYDYEETGKLYKLSGEVFDVSRKYIYRFENNAISVFFDEKPIRLFHTLVFTNQIEAKACHLCINDNYEATYEFRDEYSFTLKYKITGPKKNDLIETVFSRNLGEEI